MKSWVQQHSLSIIFLSLCLVFTLSSIFSTVPDEGWKKWFQDYTNNGSTEMLQLFLIVVLTKWFRELGSAEDKENN